MNNRKIATDIFLAGIESVKPENLIQRFVSLEGEELTLGTLKFNLSITGKVYVIGFGKASAMMAKELELILSDRICEGHIITKYHHAVPLKFMSVTEAGHPVPDENSLMGTEKILGIARKANKGDLVICLISGGGSALLADLPTGCSLSDLKDLNAVLLKSGATIQKMNCIRKHLSKVKGGQLAKIIAPATVVSLILSDVIGDQLDVIASGPTAPDQTTFANALAIVEKYNIENLIPASINQYLLDGQEGKYPETLKTDEDLMKQIHNIIVGNNTIALNESARRAEQFGYQTSIITNKLEGKTEGIANDLVEIAFKTQRERNQKKICLLFGGEPTIKVNGSGKGGRNQHLALISAKLLENRQGITILSGGTDGTDGPTEAAGAVCDSVTTQNAKQLQLDIRKFIDDYDSFHFFNAEGGLIQTGPTQTNVMDIIVVLID